MLEIGVLYNLGAFAGHSANCRTTTTADQEDGAPRQENTKLKEARKMMEKMSRGHNAKGIFPNQMRGTWNTKRVPYPSS